MEREDPLERIAREENEKSAVKGAPGNLKTTAVIMSVVAAALAVALIVLSISAKKSNDRNETLVGQLNEEKADLTRQVENLKSEFAGLSSDYDSINVQLDASRAQIDELVENLRRTEATNRSQIRKYQSELGTLRGIMRGYINQIDSLNTLNHKLTVQAKEAKEEAASAKRKNEKLTAKVEDLSSQVATGSVLKARGISLTATNASGKLVDRAGRVKSLCANLSLIANDLAPKGWTTISVKVFAPDGSELSSASREVDYEGEELDVTVYVKGIQEFRKGTYTMEASTASGKLGSASLTLR